MPVPAMSDLTTHGIRIGAAAFYLPDRSDVERGEYVFAYRIVVANQSPRTVRLLRRHWDIIDGSGKHRVVEGEGVIGQQPLLTPGQAFKYHSYARLDTHWGTMEGRYTFEVVQDPPADPGTAPAPAPETETFEAAVGRFWLTGEHVAQVQEVVGGASGAS